MSNKQEKIVDIATTHPNAAFMLLHEFSHYAIGIIYHNDAQVPWVNNHDARKTLLNEAFRADLFKNRKNRDALRTLHEDLEMSTSYKGENFIAEVPVRIIEQMSAKQWDANKIEKYPQLTRFVTDIIGRDAQHHEQGNIVLTMTEEQAQAYRDNAPVKSWLDKIRNPTVTSLSQ